MDAQLPDRGTIQEGAPILLSMLEHYSYCPRQCALIHLEQCYDENVFTLKGKEGHERVDEPIVESRAGVRCERALPLFNRKLNLVGKADMVEFPDGVPYPVEYKHGSRSGQAHAEVQVCAQALCLEEMLNVVVPKGALYSLRTHRRREVALNFALRERTLGVIEEVRAMLLLVRLPPAVNDKRCPNCSLIELCQPALMEEAHRPVLMQAWRESSELQEET